MGHLRPCSNFKCKNFNFLGVVFALIANYLLLVYEYFIVESGYFNPWFYLITIFHAMALWSYFAVVFVDPGRVPKYWGLMSQRMQGQRKYCLICHNFKPERCHHCSKCGRCVLNMDHHCPWINNCVGFQNRKYFLQFLIYLVITIALSLALMVIVLVNQIKSFSAGQKQPDVHTVVKGVLLTQFFVLQVILSIFTYTHIRYVLVNTTTLEQMVIERKKRAGDLKNDGGWQIYEDGEYNISKYYNFTQVFGVNGIYWFFPLEEETPLVGRGLYWQKRHKNESKQAQLSNTVHLSTDN